MYKMNSIATVVFYVTDLERTAKFYETIGFRFGNQETERLVCYLNWFSLEFRLTTDKPTAGSGEYIGIKVDNADEFYAGLQERGLQPASELRDTPSGTREFVLRDPDGYQLLFFHKK